MGKRGVRPLLRPCRRGRDDIIGDTERNTHANKNLHTFAARRARKDAHVYPDDAAVYQGSMAITKP